MEEIEKKLDQIRARKGVKCVMALNFKGEVLVSLPNDGYGLDDAVIQKLHMLAYSIFSSTRTAIANYDPSENLQLARVRMKDDELIIYRDEKFVLVVVQNPNS